MRQIKFRAWDKDSHKMFAIKSIDMNVRYVNCGHRLPMQHSQCLSFDDIELMQYTELKDKNGKEIYEKDIFRFVYSFDPNPSRDWNSVVVFEESCFGWIPLHPLLRSEDDQGFHSFFSEDDDGVPTNIEIIGNRFENSDLLKLSD